MIDANELRAAIRRIQWKPVHGSDDEAAVDVSPLMNEIDRLERQVNIISPVGWADQGFSSIKEARQWLLDQGIPEGWVDRAVYQTSDGTLIKLERKRKCGA
jgi:hypothetical protein